MPSTPTAPAGTRDRMIEAAIVLMRRGGLTAAGINEVVRESGAPKGSLYHFFPGGKEQLAREALGLYAARVRAFIDDALVARRTPRTRVEALFGAFAARVEAGEFLASCAAGAVTLDLGRELDALREVIASAFDAWIDALASHFPHRDPRASRSFAGLLLTAIEGAYVRARAGRSGEPFREAGRWLAPLAEQTFDR